MVIDTFIATLLLWLAFIPVANLKNRYEAKYNAGTLVWWKKYPVLLLLYLFLLVDVAYNYTYASIIFLELASNDRKTFTERLKHYLQTEPQSWRGKLAYLFCAYLIEPWDTGHCNWRN